MISIARYFLSLAAMLLGIATATPASAQPACKNERLTAKSEIRVRGEAFATNEAKQNWERLAEDRFGKSFGRWANAKDTNVECESAKSPRVGLPAKVCTVSAFPCPRDDNAAVAKEREGDRKSSRWDEDRDRDRDRLGRHYRTAYDAEMRYQEYLAKRRRQEQKWAERREEAFWRNLYRRRANAGYWD